MLVANGMRDVSLAMCLIGEINLKVIEDQIVQVAGTNQEMEDAVDQARSSIGEFFAAFENPQPNQTSFLIKARFVDGETSEHIWLADLDFNSRPATGIVSNEPGISSLTYLERVPFLPDQVSDWMYLQDGRLVGGFTTRVLLRASAKPGGFDGLLKRRFKM
jgi:uncharacterized protein YegJ (DUF2314 family)